MYGYRAVPLRQWKGGVGKCAKNTYAILGKKPPYLAYLPYLTCIFVSESNDLGETRSEIGNSNETRRKFSPLVDCTTGC